MTPHQPQKLPGDLGSGLTLAGCRLPGIPDTRSPPTARRVGVQVQCAWACAGVRVQCARVCRCRCTFPTESRSQRGRTDAGHTRPRGSRSSHAEAGPQGSCHWEPPGAARSRTPALEGCREPAPWGPLLSWVPRVGGRQAEGVVRSRQPCARTCRWPGHVSVFWGAGGARAGRETQEPWRQTWKDP